MKSASFSSASLNERENSLFGSDFSAAYDDMKCSLVIARIQCEQTYLYKVFSGDAEVRN